jgi:predicted ribosomally synthesized peptide with nif11-like leader
LSIYARHINLYYFKKERKKTMDKMNQLYEKVAADSVLQAKFNAILSDAEKAGEAVTGEKLAAFAKEAGFVVTPEEMQAFFKKLSEKKEGELSDVELDMVAGGKSLSGIFHLFTSAATVGVSCATNSAIEETKSRYSDGILPNCQDYFS